MKKIYVCYVETYEDGTLTQLAGCTMLQSFTEKQKALEYVKGMRDKQCHDVSLRKEHMGGSEIRVWFDNSTNSLGFVWVVRQMNLQE